MPNELVLLFVCVLSNHDSHSILDTDQHAFIWRAEGGGSVACTRNSTLACVFLCVCGHPCVSISLTAPLNENTLSGLADLCCGPPPSHNASTGTSVILSIMANGKLSAF